LDKKTKIYIGFFIAIVLLLVYLDATKQKPVNWFPSYAGKDKIPFGMFVLRKQMTTLLPNTKVREIKESPYVFLQDSTVSGTYFFVNGFINFGKDEFNEILKFVERGNDVFVATNGANIDTLNLKTKTFFVTNFEENYQISLLNKNVSTKKYNFDKPSSKIYFSEIDTLHTIALGRISASDKKDSIVSEGINFIKQKHGKGTFYFHTFPLAFTNYNILKDDNNIYVSDVLSYLDPKKPILWDEYYKNGKSKITSPFYFILSSPNLKWAYYSAIIGLILFVVFKGKREQRYIPIVTPLKNQTLAFTRTIANMYYEKGHHKTIASHKINYFLDYIRTKLHISTLKIDTYFYKNTASRSNNIEEDVKKLFDKIKVIEQKSEITKEELIELNTLIERFKNAQSVL